MRKLLLTGSLLAVTACGSNSLSDPTDARTWANAASAVGVFAHVHDPLALADGHFTFPDSVCPLVVDDGTTVSITGGCTDSLSAEWVGSVTIVRATSGDRTMTFNHYGNGGAGGAKVNGTFTLHAMSASQHTFDANYTVEGGTSTTVTYSGRVEGTYGTPTIWNGSGTVSRSGFTSPQGTVTATTTDERVDDTVCSGAPASGSTTIRAGAQTAVITYDGATDCDSTHNARWSVDGVDRGLLDGITCTAVPGGHAPGLVALGALGVSALVLSRRRARRR